MSLLPVSPVTTLAAAGTAAGVARGVVVGTFGRLLEAAIGAAQGQPAADAAESLPGSSGGPSAARPHDVSAARQRVAALKSRFLTRFRELLAEHGIQDVGLVRLRLDEFGELRVVGSHPHSSEIEHVAMASPELVATFQELAAASRVLQSPASAAGPFAGADAMAGLVLTIAGDSVHGMFVA